MMSAISKTKGWGEGGGGGGKGGGRGGEGGGASNVKNIHLRFQANCILIDSFYKGGRAGRAGRAESPKGD